MKRLFAALTAATLIMGCASTPKAPRSVEEAGIKPGDSKALTLMKLVDLEQNLYDVEVGDKFEEDGFGAGSAAILGTAGYKGVGLVNAGGLAGSLGTLGIGLFMTGSDAAEKNFVFILLSKTPGTSTGVLREAAKSSGGNFSEAEYSGRLGFTFYNLKELPNCTEKGFCEAYAYHDVTTVLPGELATLSDAGVPIYVSYIKAPHVLAEKIFSSLKAEATIETFMYVPPATVGELSGKNKFKYVEEFPYVISAKDDSVFLFAKK